MMGVCPVGGLLGHVVVLFLVFKGISMLFSIVTVSVYIPTTALFIVARTWKQPRCPPTDKWIKKLWYMYTMEYYSAIKRKTFESVLMRWMNLEPIIQREVSQKEKSNYWVLTHISRDITLPTKVQLVKVMVFPVVMYGCESWTMKKAKHQRIDAFELWCWRRLLKVPWTARRSNQSILKEMSPGCSLEGLML